MAYDLRNTHVKLLAFNLNTLTQTRTDPIHFLLKPSLRITRIETLGVIVTRDLKHGKFLKFTIDDGTGIVTCILWLNQLTSGYFSRRSESDVKLMAEMASGFAEMVKVGVVVRVRGRIGSYRGCVQIVVKDLVVANDPNEEIVHWLDCVKLARDCYDVERP